MSKTFTDLLDAIRRSSPTSLPRRIVRGVQREFLPMPMPMPHRRLIAGTLRLIADELDRAPPPRQP